jgi:hypothetical protein
MHCGGVSSGMWLDIAPMLAAVDSNVPAPCAVIAVGCAAWRRWWQIANPLRNLGF